MFNKWLKKQDEETEKDVDAVEEVVSESTADQNELVATESSALSYDSDDEDEYYYYYYEEDMFEDVKDVSDYDKVPGEIYDESKQVYNSPFDVNDKKVIEENLYEDEPLINDDINEIKASLDESTEKAALLEAENETLRDQLDQYSSLAKDHEAQVALTNELTEQNNSLVMQIEAALKVIEEHEHLERQTAEFDDLSEKHSDLEKHNQELRHTVDSLMKQVDEITETADAKEQEFVNLLKVVEDKDLEITKLSESLHLTEKTAQSDEEVVTTLKAELAEKQTLITTQSDMIDKLTHDNQELLVKQAELEAKIEELTADLLKFDDVKRVVTDLEEQLQASKSLETTITKQYEDELENVILAKEELKKMEQELTDMTENLENQLDQTEKLEKELQELRENQRVINELEKEINNMRTQQERLSTDLTELSIEKSKAQALAHEVEELKAQKSPETDRLQDELRRVKEELRITKLRAENQSGTNQSDIAQVMIEAQAKAREIVDVANYEAKRRIADAETELSVVSQEARNYYRKLETIKFESEVVFSELLRKLESIGEIDRF